MHRYPHSWLGYGKPRQGASDCSSRFVTGNPDFPAHTCNTRSRSRLSLVTSFYIVDAAITSLPEMDCSPTSEEWIPNHEDPDLLSPWNTRIEYQGHKYF